MTVIYKITNTENGKKYVGQTIDFNKRKSDYKSVSFNPNSSDYKRPIHSAIRKYGWKKFQFSILEEISKDEDQSFVDERERFFIQELDCLVGGGKGYNVELGGTRGETKLKLTFEERVALSKLFSLEQVVDIQTMLQEDSEFDEIEKKYSNLKRSFLLNINCGIAFKNEKLDYPLKKHSKSRYSQKEIADIKRMISEKVDWAEIMAKYSIKSPGFISNINTGRMFPDKDVEYPLYKSKFGRSMSKKAQELMTFTDFDSSLSEREIFEIIAKEVGYNQLTSLRRINRGHTRKNPELNYPLLENQEHNRKCL